MKNAIDKTHTSSLDNTETEAFDTYLKQNVDYSKIIQRSDKTLTTEESVLQNVGLYTTVIFGSLIMIFIVFLLARVLYF